MTDTLSSDTEQWIKLWYEELRWGKRVRVLDYQREYQRKKREGRTPKPRYKMKPMQLRTNND